LLVVSPPPPSSPPTPPALARYRRSPGCDSKIVLAAYVDGPDDYSSIIIAYTLSSSACVRITIPNDSHQKCTTELRNSPWLSARGRGRSEADRGTDGRSDLRAVRYVDRRRLRECVGGNVNTKHARVSVLQACPDVGNSTAGQVPRGTAREGWPFYPETRTHT
jgi:hypothetical protein